MTSLHVEVAHLYAGEALGSQQAATMAAARRSLEAYPADVKTSVLVDGRGAGALPSDQDIVTFAQVNGISLSAIMREEALSALGNELLGRIPETLIRREYIRKRGKTAIMMTGAKQIGLGLLDPNGIDWSCAMLSAIWTLCRLGALPFPKQGIVSIDGGDLAAERTLTVISSEFFDVERKALAICTAAGFGHEIERTSYLWVPSLETLEVA